MGNGRREPMRVVENPMSAVTIPVEGAVLEGELRAPAQAGGLVLFAHGTGSSRHSWRNQRVADVLNDVGIASLLFNLLTPEEDQENVFDARLRENVTLLAGRLRRATHWARQQPQMVNLPIGYYGASTGAAAAIAAAAAEGRRVTAIVTRGARAEFDGPALNEVKAATLLIVGANDEPAAAQNLEAWARLPGRKAIEIIPGTGHLFEEPGALDNVAALTARWFSTHLRRDADTP